MNYRYNYRFYNETPLTILSPAENPACTVKCSPPLVKFH